jgi:glucose/arabinose dehydrogenase
MFIGDVGQDAWEEIDIYPANSPGGANFGWNYREGAHPYRKDAPPTGTTLIDPIAEYDHSQGESVTGGYVYRGESLPEWSGIYLYGDFASGKIWGLFPSPTGIWQNTLLFETGSAITSFGEDEQGEVYYTDYGGDVYRLSQKGS